MGMPPSFGQNPAAWWGGQGFGALGRPGAVPTATAGSPNVESPSVGLPPGTQLINPPTNPQQADLWTRVMNAVGNPGAGGFKMPGTTIGAPAGQTPPALPPAPMLPQGQAMPPPGMGAYFRQQQFPTAAGGAGNSQLMAQYMALQQLMRGA